MNEEAEAYGNAEKILGEIAKPFREDVYIATKVGVKEIIFNKKFRKFISINSLTLSY